MRLLVITTAMLIGLTVACNKDDALFLTESTRIKAELQRYKDQEDADQRLGQYVINMMYVAGAKDTVSDAKKQILARAIVRVANDIFTSEENKRAFVMMIAIESAFQRFAQSPTGPKGYAQVAKAAFYEAMNDCGVTGLREDDVWETDLNLYAGACYFKKLLVKYNNDPYIAIVAYNQGPNSASAKSYAKNGSLKEIEPLKYVAKFTFLARTVTDKKQPNVPAIDMTTPVKVKAKQ